MKGIQRIVPSSARLMMAVFALSAGAATPAQDLPAIQAAPEPLILQAQGSFFVGGESRSFTPTELAINSDKPGHITVDQMYVRYMIPQAAAKAPLILVHGDTLSGKSYETTPDGRMGWDEYFVRKGHEVYNVDWAGVGRSGYNPAAFNNVRAGVAPPKSQPLVERCDDEICSWPMFRIGPSAGVQYPGQQFPVAAIREFSKQNVPALWDRTPADIGTPPQSPSSKALAELGGQKLKGRGVVIAHSYGGSYIVDALQIDPNAFRAVIFLEGTPNDQSRFTDTQIAKIAKVPVLCLWGDNVDGSTGTPGFTWRSVYDDCKAFVKRINAAGGHGEVLDLPSMGVKGNGHMLMMEKNNIQVADIIMAWIDRNAGRSVSSQGH